MQSYFDLLAQSVEHLTFNQGVRTIIINVARAQANKAMQSYFDLLAQSVEHLTFNQGVRSSSLR